MFMRRDVWDEYQKDLQLVISSLESNKVYQAQKYISKNWANLPNCIETEIKRSFSSEKLLGGNNIVKCYDCKNEILGVNKEIKNDMFFIQIYEGFAKLIDLNFKPLINIPEKCHECNKWVCGNGLCDCKCFFDEYDCFWIDEL
ncbi:hypothetical protein [Spiroplasma helicoides]|uniref:hypothetical protein n=1 Tax=Spiroplasma helicoides TaxID=216938 RepID=UPI001E4214C6|nr:hypothetical protein [Spiroplasma helicoides]